jgi:hypothetical protein
MEKVHNNEVVAVAYIAAAIARVIKKCPAGVAVHCH